MLENLINPRAAEKQPSSLFLVGLLYAAISFLIVALIFSKDNSFASHSSVLIITFTTMFSIPFMYFLTRVLEIKEVIRGRGRTLFSEHAKALIALLFLFLGFLVAFSLIYILLPQDISNTNFHSQIQKYCEINPGEESCSEYTAGITGKVIGFGSVLEIFLNNLYVLIFVLIFSLAFGAGAIFILAWNASVIAVAVGMAIKNFANFNILFAYILHGLPEIASYFIAALAGGIISIAIIRHDTKGKTFLDLAVDSTFLILSSLLLLFLAALIEVYISSFLL